MIVAPAACSGDARRQGLEARSDTDQSTSCSVGDIVEASLDQVSQLTRQLEQADDDNCADIRQLLLARLRQVERILDTHAGRLRKILLQQLHDELRETAVAVESWETSKGFPWLRSANTGNEMRIHAGKLMALIEESGLGHLVESAGANGKQRAGPRCMLIVQKTEQPGQLRQEWQQASRTNTDIVASTPVAVPCIPRPPTPSLRCTTPLTSSRTCPSPCISNCGSTGSGGGASMAHVMSVG